MPGCGGFDVDAIKAYNQIELPDECPPTWCSMPRHRWPKEWEGRFEDPVVPMVRNLYGHPRAGNYWEQHVDKAVRSEGFKSIPGWECLYFHWELRIIISVYVDDFKI